MSRCPWPLNGTLWRPRRPSSGPGALTRASGRVMLVPVDDASTEGTGTRYLVVVGSRCPSSGCLICRLVSHWDIFPGSAYIRGFVQAQRGECTGRYVSSGTKSDDYVFSCNFTLSPAICTRIVQMLLSLFSNTNNGMVKKGIIAPPVSWELELGTLLAYQNHVSSCRLDCAFPWRNRCLSGLHS